MEYTLTSYLERRSSCELVCFLEHCKCQNLWEEYQLSIPAILQILNSREFLIPEPILDSWIQFSGNDAKV